MQDSKINTETKSVEGSASLWILNRLKNKNDTTLKTFTLKFGPNTIGRALHNDIILENENISKSHCRIWIENNNIPILDEIDSRNGTYVKDTKIERLERYKLIDNDIIYLSGATLGVTLQICTTFKVDKKTNTSLVLSDCNVTKKLKRSSDELKSDCIDSTFDNKNQRGFDNSAPIIMPLDVTNEPINLKEIWATEWALKFIEHMNTTESGDSDSLESCCLSINNSILNVEEKNQDNNNIKIKYNQKNNKIFNNQNLPITCSTSFDILNKDESSTSIELHQHHNNSEIVVETINQNNEMVNSMDKTSTNQNILNSSNNNINVKLSTINDYLLEAISYICKWDAKWLQKYKISDQMPPLVNAIQKMKSHFESLQDYLLTLKSLFLYEIWSSIMQSYHLLEKKIPSLESFIYAESASNSPLLRLTVKSLDKEFTSLNKNLSTPLWCLTCILKLDQKRDHNVRFPDSGDLLLLTTEINKNTKNVFFAYTDGVLNSISHEGMKKKQIILSLLITEKSFNILENTPVQCLSLFYVCAELRLFQSICSVSISPLHNAIAMPSLHKNTNPTFTFISDVMKKNMENLDCNQKKALMIGVGLGLSQNSDICLINGFPGTGKTHVVINIVQSLILAKVLNKKSTKVLLCASSNIAVDELVQRLLFIKEKTPHLKNINLVKVGNKNSEISLDSLVNKKIAEINEDSMVCAVFK
ncbi:uncharacterized protein LOC126894413 [Daktulosphaira vitifoliae]|uniref:uncharacterized protein LOC126894413 n=1 Tax=Daktulosphaira vitifoliae TaxID=58002 RepID=UPI0021AA16ED|nr:uncharacterized protein LOC126894413 [Daktulosphaira vitifoliae]